MHILITGSAGHLGQALVRTLKSNGHTVTGLDIAASPETDVVGSITDPTCVRHCMRGVHAVLHTATLHKPHIATHTRQDFVDTNISGTLTLLEAAVDAGVSAFIFTSTTSTFGDALTPPPDAPAAWITEEVTPRPKNIYGMTKTAAEDLCLLFHRRYGLPALVLRTSRFFPEADDNADARTAYADTNLKVVELLHRRVDLADVVSAHIAALAAAQRIGFGRFIISATSPFDRHDLAQLRGNAAAALRAKVPGFDAVFRSRGWTMPDDIDRVYVNEHARTVLGWTPEYTFARALEDISHDRDHRSPLAQATRFRGYHGDQYTDGRYPVMP
jgi:UDP-glucose 4-epimerase